MNRRIIITVVVVSIGVVVWAELFYFRFHTYFQRTEVQEVLPSVSSVQVSEEPRTLVQGSFGRIDSIHKGSGTARIVEQNGKQYVRLENFEVTNGPDLYVYLSTSTTPGASVHSLGEYINLGRLKGNAGNQTYEVSESVRDHTTVVIWCRKFGVLFSYAVMQ